MVDKESIFLSFVDLLSKWDGHYIGCGNIYSHILIIGKECALDTKSEIYKNDFQKNFELWNSKPTKSFDEVESWFGGRAWPWDDFHPAAPYKGQRFTIERHSRIDSRIIISGEGGTNSTWYNYQKLINLYREQNNGLKPNTSKIDFFKDCFITELSSVVRKNNSNNSQTDHLATKNSIIERLDLMKMTKSFWSHFDYVILACGPYADAFRKDNQLVKDIFGDSYVILSTKDGRKIPQLSSPIRDEFNLMQDIVSQMTTQR